METNEEKRTRSNMAKLAIATVTYRFYLRVEDDELPLWPSKDDPNGPSMHKLLERDCMTAIMRGAESPVNKSVWEWHGDRIDPAFLNSIAYGDNPDELTVQEVAERHRNYNWKIDEDNATL